jgi:hypothetical protein
VRVTDEAGNTDPTPASYTWIIEPLADTTPPETVIGAAPPATTTSTSAAFTFSANEPGSTFECSLDEAPFAECISPAAYADLATGEHTFAVRARDEAGNTDPTPASYTWTIEPLADTTPPETTIDSGPEATTTSTEATFTFSASEPGSIFICSLDESAFAGCVSPVQLTGLAVGEHTFAVQAIDPARNIDPMPASYTWTIEVPADTTPPETTIDTGPPATTGDTSATFTFSADETGSTFECSLDEAPFGECISPVEYTSLSEGSHSFEVRAIDLAGNIDLTPTSYTWTVEAAADITPPETTINSGPPAMTEETSATFTFSADETGSTFECSLDEAPFAECVSPAVYTDLATGSHTFAVQAIDPARNIDPTPASYTWTIEPPADTTPPETTINSGPSATTEETSATFTFSANEAGSTFECSLDEAPFTECVSPAAYSDLAVGEHTFEVRAINPVGNTDPTPASYTWTIGAPPDCGSEVTVFAEADSWIDQNSSSNNFGSDAILKVRSQSSNNNFRALVRFTLPSDVPDGCVVESATLRLYAASATLGRKLEALQIADNWSENAVTWENQPQTAGEEATTSSGSGYRQWDVATQVQAIYDTGANHGFLIRDADEGEDAEQQFHSREKGENPPQLVIRFAPAGG